jgi:hypothetical protein
MRTVVATLLYLAGAVLVVFGFWSAWAPLGYLVAGGLVVGCGYVLDPSGDA